MKENTKGFTLIELLAVIVILAIIALIATPIVLNLIDQARRGAAESDAYAYVKAFETGVATKMLDDKSINLNNNDTCTTAGKTVTCTDSTMTDSTSGSSTALVVTAEVKGATPKSGTVIVSDSGTVTSYALKVGGYCVKPNKNGEAKATAESDCDTTNPDAGA